MEFGRAGVWQKHTIDKDAACLFSFEQTNLWGGHPPWKTENVPSRGVLQLCQWAAVGGLDCHSWTYKLIYTTANWAFKYQPHSEHSCFALPSSITPLVTDHFHTRMSPKGILVVSQRHFPMRPPLPKVPPPQSPPEHKGKGAIPAPTNMSHYATFMKELEIPENGFSRSLGNPSTAAGWAAAFPRDSWCLRLQIALLWLTTLWRTLRNLESPRSTCQGSTPLIKRIEVLCHSSID